MNFCNFATELNGQLDINKAATICIRPEFGPKLLNLLDGFANPKRYWDGHQIKA